jgi:hypothetical protein
MNGMYTSMNFPGLASAKDLVKKYFTYRLTHELFCIHFVY